MFYKKNDIRLDLLQMVEHFKAIKTPLKTLMIMLFNNIDV